MAKAAPKKETSAKKAVRKSAAAEPSVRKKAAPVKAAPKKAAAAKAAPKATAKRPVDRPPSKKKAAAAPAKRPLGRPPGKKNAAAAKVAAKRPVGRPPAKKAAAPAKRGRPPGKKVAARKVTKQTFNVSHLNEADFQADGLRTYAHYRDLGIAAATNGLCQAHVIRLIPPCTDEVRKRHIHAAELQLIYVLKGWIKNEFEGHGQQMMSAGTCWLQPPGIQHTVLDYSADCEILEIIVPADFKTKEVA
jgi:uncharacterized RmlC-like cupin family protein